MERKVKKPYNGTNRARDFWSFIGVVGVLLWFLYCLFGRFL
jgi:hypothetical protein